MSNVALDRVPPPFALTPASLIGVSEEQTFAITVDQSIKQITLKYSNLHAASVSPSQSPLGYFCCNNPVVARLQQGPTCGLVSLRMVAESLLESLDVKLEPTQTLLEEAKSLGMTGYGEMFSAQEMARLVEKYYSKALNGAAWSDRWDTASVKEILASMCRGLFFLVPYDVDKNHEPCCNGGKSAHWAALKGWVFPLYQQSQLDYALSLVPSHSCSQDLLNNVPFITFTPELRSLPKEQILLDRLIDFSKFGEAGMRDTHTSQDISPDYSENALRIIAQQSKSRHQAIWQFSKLRESNLNLKQFDFTRVIDSNFVVPDELEGLRGKIVLVSPATER